MGYPPYSTFRRERWVATEVAAPDEIATQINRCPARTLDYLRTGATPSAGGDAPMLEPEYRDALRFWETRRVAYNLALASLCTAWVVITWPHFQPAFTMNALGKVLVLALIMNVLYSAAYFIDIPAQYSGRAASWRRHRWILWLAGTLFALLLAHYWIGDEIYPAVDEVTSAGAGGDPPCFASKLGLPCQP